MAFLISLLFMVMCSTNVLGGKVAMKDCPAGTTGLPTGGNKLIFDGVDVQGCDKDPCVFYMGETYAIEINATANFATKKMTYSMSGVIQNSPGVPVATDENFCAFLVSGSCDNISPGTKITARRNQKVEGVPIFSGTMRSIIKDENKVSVYCGEFNVFVQTKLPSFPTSFGGK